MTWSKCDLRLNDLIHLGLMLVALAAAFVVPFELLLLAYVVLGPAHYITEISWLHDRDYFLPHRGIAVALAMLAVVAAFITNASWFGFAIWGALIICAILAATTSALEGMVMFMIAIVLSAIMFSTGTSLAVVGVLIPTLIHVSLFTLVFMVLGAYRSRSRAQALLVVGYIAAIALLLLVPMTAEIRIASFAKAGQEFFEGVGPALGNLLGIPGLKLDTRLTSLLAFIYTYHYLNWFIKADVIRWADVPKARLAIMIAASAVSTGLYFYNYTFGFILLLALSLAHVLLEFPLNALALRQLGGATTSGLRRAIAGAPVRAAGASPARRPAASRSGKPPRSAR